MNGSKKKVNNTEISDLRKYLLHLKLNLYEFMYTEINFTKKNKIIKHVKIIICIPCTLVGIKKKLKKEEKNTK